eukprot:736982-Pelagomonas_calceolata.AAC.2
MTRSDASIWLRFTKSIIWPCPQTSSKEFYLNVINLELHPHICHSVAVHKRCRFLLSALLVADFGAPPKAVRHGFHT